MFGLAHTFSIGASVMTVKNTDDKGPCHIWLVVAGQAEKVESDPVVDELAGLLNKGGCVVEARMMVRNSLDAIRQVLLDACESGKVDAMVFVGGVGICASDVVPEALEPLFSKALPGFGEVFRQLYFKEKGAGGLLSRATA